jgi:hypothetical protein
MGVTKEGRGHCTCCKRPTLAFVPPPSRRWRNTGQLGIDGATRLRNLSMAAGVVLGGLVPIAASPDSCSALGLLWLQELSPVRVPPRSRSERYHHPCQPSAGS